MCNLENSMFRCFPLHGQWEWHSFLFFFCMGLIWSVNNCYIYLYPSPESYLEHSFGRCHCLAVIVVPVILVIKSN